MLLSDIFRKEQNTVSPILLEKDKILTAFPLESRKPTGIGSGHITEARKIWEGDSCHTAMEFCRWESTCFQNTISFWILCSLSASEVCFFASRYFAYGIQTGSCTWILLIPSYFAATFRMSLYLLIRYSSKKVVSVWLARGIQKMSDWSR